MVSRPDVLVDAGRESAAITMYKDGTLRRCHDAALMKLI